MLRGSVVAATKTLTCFAFASFRSKFGYLLLHLNFVARNLLQGILARRDELLGCPAIRDARSSLINAQIGVARLDSLSSLFPLVAVVQKCPRVVRKLFPGMIRA